MLLDISLFDVLYAWAFILWLFLELLWPYWLIPVIVFVIKKMIRR